jgi:hypothetical protein
VRLREKKPYFRLFILFIPRLASVIYLSFKTLRLDARDVGTKENPRRDPTRFYGILESSF